MKNLRTTIDQWLEGLDKHWESMPIKKQRQFILCFFAGYVLMSAAVIFKVCRDTAEDKNNMAVGHIQNPVPAQKENPAHLQDSLKSILKK